MLYNYHCTNFEEPPILRKSGVESITNKLDPIAFSKLPPEMQYQILKEATSRGTFSDALRTLARLDQVSPTWRQMTQSLWKYILVKHFSTEEINRAARILVALGWPPTIKNTLNVLSIQPAREEGGHSVELNTSSEFIVYAENNGAYPITLDILKEQYVARPEILRHVVNPGANYMSSLIHPYPAGTYDLGYYCQNPSINCKGFVTIYTANLDGGAISMGG